MKMPKEKKEDKTNYIKPNKVLWFGVHKGAKIKECTLGYLKWLAENIKEDTDENKTICLTADYLYQKRIREEL